MTIGSETTTSKTKICKQANTWPSLSLTGMTQLEWANVTSQ